MPIVVHQAKAELFRTLGHPARIRILELLTEREQLVHAMLALRQQFEDADPGGVPERAEELRLRLVHHDGHRHPPPDANRLATEQLFMFRNGAGMERAPGAGPTEAST